MANTYISRSNASGTSTQKGTISVWIKSSEEPSGNNQTTLASWGDANNHGALLWNGSDKIDAFDYQSGYASQLQTNALLRDCSAWYHIVYSWDTTLATANDRQKIYINGVEQGYATRTNYSVNATTSWNANSYSMRVGALNSSSYFRGSMSHIHFIDGIQYPASTFGSTDATSGIWTINTSPSVTSYGTNGFFILKDGNTITDSSPNSNNFSLGGGTLTNTQDCPDNNYPSVNINTGKATEYLNSTGLRYGNTQINQAGNNAVFISTLANTTGKYYWEMLIDAVGYTTQGIITYDALIQNGGGTYLYTPATGYGYVYTGNKGNNNSQVSYGASYTSGDYISVAFDQTNGSIWFAKNGAWQNSATTAEIGAGTTTNSAYSSMPTNGEFYAAAFGLDNNAVTSINYGNGTFGTTTLSTTYSPTVGDTGAKFKYNIIPTGFTAISTKGYNA